MLMITAAQDALAQFALVLPRIGAALLVLPLLAPDTVPPGVRNALIVALALAAAPLVSPGAGGVAIEGATLLPFVLKEALIGAVIGFAFGIAFWALGMAGELIDQKIGATAAQATDPSSGNTGGTMGMLLTRLGTVLFVALGGVPVFFGLVFDSYRVWPMQSFWPALDMQASAFHIERGADLLRIALLVAAPVWGVLLLVELGFGLINRYAKQLNVFAMSMAIKGWLAVAVLLLMLGTIADTVAAWIGAQRGLLEALQAALPAPPPSSPR
jgi:type III secretion protein T